MGLKSMLLVGCGSFVGGVLRYLCVLGSDRLSPDSAFPIGVFLVNVVGSFAIGLLVPAVAGRGGAVALFWSMGVMGGFTTFSTFSLETLRLAQNGQWTLAATNAVGSVTCCVLATLAGIKLGYQLFE